MSFRLQKIKALIGFTSTELRVIQGLSLAHDDKKEKPDVFVNIYITNEILAIKLGLCPRTIERTTKKLKEKGVLINAKRHNNAKNYWTLLVKKIELIHDETIRITKNKIAEVRARKLSTSATFEGVKVIHECDIMSGEVRQDVALECDIVSHNHISDPINYLKNKKGAYAVKKKKIGSPDEAAKALSEELDILIANNELPGKYKKRDLLIEVGFYLGNHLDSLTDKLYEAIYLIKHGKWDVPFQLRHQRKQEAITRERESMARHRLPIEAGLELGRGALAQFG